MTKISDWTDLKPGTYILLGYNLYLKPEFQTEYQNWRGK
jgi:hypothetical protein